MKYLKYFNESVNFEEGRQIGFPYTQVELSDLLIDLTDYGFVVEKINQYFTDGRIYDSTDITKARYAITDIILKKRKSTDYTRVISDSGGEYGRRYIGLLKGDKESEIIQDSLIEFCRRIKETYYSVHINGGLIEIFIKIETPVVESDKNKAIDQLVLSASKDLLSDKLSYVRGEFKKRMAKSGRTQVIENVFKNKLGETMTGYLSNQGKGICYNIFNLENIKTKQSRNAVYDILEDINVSNNRIFSDFGGSELKEITEKDIKIMSGLMDGSTEEYFSERHLGLTAIVTTFDYNKMINDLKKLSSIKYKN